MKISALISMMGLWTLTVHGVQTEKVANPTFETTLEAKISEVKAALSISNTELKRKISLLEKLALLFLHKYAYAVDHGIYLQHEAIACLDQAVSLISDNYTNDPEMNDTLLRLQIFRGNTFTDQGLISNASSAFNIADSYTKTTTDVALLNYHRGKSMGHFGQYNEAVLLIQKALDKCPFLISAYYPLVLSHRHLNILSKSDWKALFNNMEHALRKYGIRKKSVQQAIRAFGDSARMTGDDRDYSLPVINPEEIRNGDIYWALFEAADYLGYVTKAWNYLDMAHEVQNESQEAYDKNTVAIQTGHIKSAFKSDFWKSAAKGVGLPSAVPVFIVGMLRSGTSLLEHMLAAHDEVYGLGDGSAFAPLLAEAREGIVSEMSKPSAQQNAPKTLRKIATKVLNIIEEKMTNDSSIPAVKKKSGAVKRVLDKSTTNFRTLGVIHYMFPEALIINVNRDPMDTIFSCYTNQHSGKVLANWASSQDSLVFEYLQYLEIMDHYRSVLTDQIIDVSYEELVTQPEPVLRSLLTRLGLDWDAKVLEGFNVRRDVPLRARPQLLLGLDVNGIGAWRRYSDQLLSSSVPLLRVLPGVRSKGLVPFAESMNWHLDPAFDYPTPVADEKEDLVEKELSLEKIKKRRMGLDVNKAKTKQKNSKSKSSGKKKQKKGKKGSAKPGAKASSTSSEKNKLKKSGQKPKTETVSSSVQRKNKKTKVGLIVPVTSTGSTGRSVESFPLLKVLIPSLKKTLSNESKWASIFMFLGYDEGDPIYDNSDNLASITMTMATSVPSIVLKPIKFINSMGAIAYIWNELVAKAYDDGVEYFIVLSDDALLLRKGWMQNLVTALHSNPVLADLGTVAFFEEHKRLKPGTFPTFPVFHRTHLEIFGRNGTIHPVIFNSFADPYISDLYVIFNSSKIVSKAKLKNTIGGEDTPRYNPHTPELTDYVDAVEKGRRKIAVWLSGQQSLSEPLLWTPKSLAYGPEGLHYSEYCKVVGCVLE